MEVQRKGIGGHTGKSTNICFDCQKACGGCSWSELDPKTGKPRFEPVPGWTAKDVLLNIGHLKSGDRFVKTYRISACPEFVPDEKRRVDHRQLTQEQSDYFLQYIGRVLRRWEDG